MDVTKIPLYPPASWFEHPGNIPTDRRITITDEGRVFGYVKLRGSCHTGARGCLDAPDESPSNFGFAHQGQTKTAEGGVIDTAIIAGGSKRHASITDPNVDIIRAAAHYQEGTENQLMRVRYGSDQNGIWFAGALWPDANQLDVAHILASPNSGDWRFVNFRGRGNHDFAGAVLVNIPGYVMDNAGASRSIGGGMEAIAASGGIMLDDAGNVTAYTPADTTPEEPSMCQSCTCQNKPPVTAAPATPCTCDQQKPTCDCGGKNVEKPDSVKALIASAGEDGAEVSFEEAVAMKFEEVFARLEAHGTSIGTIEARRLAEQIME